jgi:DNA-directed RNA polymerase beta subunit
MCRCGHSSLLQTDASEGRKDVGLERVFNEIFPITDVNEKLSLEFVNYSWASRSTASRSASSGT